MSNPINPAKTSQHRPNKALHPTAYSFGFPVVPRSKPSLPAAGELGRSAAARGFDLCDNKNTSMNNPPYPHEPNWAEAEKLLYSKSCEAISRFVIEYPNALCSSFGFYLQPDYTSAFIAFDTLKNAIESAKQSEEREIKKRVEQFASDFAWQNAEFNLTFRQSYAHSRNTGDFEFFDYEQVAFDGWEEFFADFEAGLPSKDDPAYDAEETRACKAYGKYMNGHALLIFWKVIEKLIAEREIYKLNLASPFRLGFDFHDAGPMVVFRILNWPETD